MAKSKISRKSGKGAIVGIALGAVALSGVAFSAWILSGQTPDTANNISVSVGSVKDHRLKISGATVQSNDNLVFDCNATDTSGPIIYDSSDNLGGEKMSFTVTFYIEGALVNGEWAPYFNGFSVSLGYMNADGNASMSAGNEGMASAITSNWIVPPVTIGDEEGASITTLPSVSEGSIGSEAVSPDSNVNLKAVYEKAANDGSYSSSTDVKVTLTVIFTWGTAFSNTNPGDFADNSMSESELNSIMSALNSLHAASGAGLSVTLTPLVKVK